MTQRKNISRQARDLTASFAAERSGATAIEYGIIAGSLSIAIAVSVYGVGSALNTVFTTIVGLF